MVPELEYIAFEPDKSIRLFRMNIPNTKTTLNRVALSSTTEKKFYIFLKMLTHHWKIKEVLSEIIKVTKLDDVGLSNIKLLKIDSEGHELEALIGATNTLKQIEYIPLILVRKRNRTEKNFT